MIGVLIVIIASFITGGVYIYGKVERIDERTAFMPSVNSLIVTQDMLQNKCSQVTFDSFMVVFCTYVKSQERRAIKQDSINKSLLKLLIIRGECDSVTYSTKEWIKVAKKLCKNC